MSIFFPIEGKPGEFEEVFKGACLYEREMNGYHDSDFYMVCWDDEAGKPVERMVGTTRFPYSVKAVVDASSEVVEKFEAYNKRIAVAKENAIVRVGKMVKVVRGRKIPKGIVGKVFWVGVCKFSGKLRAGVELEDGSKVFIAGDNVKPVVAS